MIAFCAILVSPLLGQALAGSIPFPQFESLFAAAP
jgi:hypothetical protein